jgi:hypothetical protein
MWHLLAWLAIATAAVLSPPAAAHDMTDSFDTCGEGSFGPWTEWYAVCAAADPSAFAPGAPNRLPPLH